MFKNEAGKIYGDLQIIDFAGAKKGTARWNCRCSCGKTKIISGSTLRSGRSKTCGHNAGKYNNINQKTHGQSHTRLYVIWHTMLRRCRDKKHVGYTRYGAQGITVCDAWLDFTIFAADMGNPITKHHTLDRINNDLGYFKLNCRWATYKEQAQNRRKPKPRVPDEVSVHTNAASETA